MQGLMSLLQQNPQLMQYLMQLQQRSYAIGGYVEGPGTGRSDDVKAGIYQNGQKVQEARLSDGEFVFKEKSVVGAGNGNRELGAKRLYAMMDKFERMA